MLINVITLNLFLQLINLVENTIEHDKYLPARRAATLVLSNILAGIPNLNDFDKCLLPIYRLLNRIAEHDDDRQVRIHAQNGLDQLKAKIKEFLTPELKMQKEIKIFGIKDEPVKKTGHILEIT